MCRRFDSGSRHQLISKVITVFDFLSRKFSGILSWLQDKGRLTEENIADAIKQVRDALIEADVPHALVETFLVEIEKEVVGQKTQKSINPGQQFIKIVHDKLLFFLGGKSSTSLSFQIPSTIMMLGLQGSGKTTTLAKIANWLSNEAKKRHKSRRILCASIDFYRPAAIEQLAILAKQVNIDFYRAISTDPVKASAEIAAYAKNNQYEYLLLDTAGRLHIDNTLMTELIAVNSAINPKYKILVLDAMTGQESLNVARAFDQTVGFDSAILSKMDSDTRGGAAFSFRYALKKPIIFVGSGEKIDDLEQFIPERAANRMLGMGDILTLLEKADEKIDTNTQEDLSRRFLQGNFTLDDFAKQLDMVDKIGPLSKILKYIPGTPTVSSAHIEEGQREMRRFKAILSSMTHKERLFPTLLDSSRKQRIARGSGTSVQEVNKLLARFEQSKQFAKMIKKGGKFGSFFK